MVRHIVALTLLAFLVGTSVAAGPIHTAAAAGDVARV
jgi:hypothetical protein